ncbi:MAG: TIGR02300 family protein [Alphaproteobacteria bacterium]|nr:TIGR02300 family protein [Alphaproteobacteria bacterium]
MAKPEWGVKRTCQSCGAVFYDLRRDPITCPKCGVEYDPEAVLKSRRGRAVPADEPKPVPVEVEPAEAEAVEEVEKQGAAEEEEEEAAAVIEDTSDLGEDTDDLGEVMENVEDNEKEP